MQQPKAGDLAFSRAGGRKLWWWRRAVMWFTKSEWTHVAICTGKGTQIESIKGIGVVENPLDPNCTILTTNLTDQQRAAVVAWARSQIGQKYNWWEFVAAGLPFLRPLVALIKGAGHICCVLANVGIRLQGLFLTAHEICSPGELFDAVSAAAVA